MKIDKADRRDKIKKNKKNQMPKNRSVFTILNIIIKRANKKAGKK